MFRTYKIKQLNLTLIISIIVITIIGIAVIGSANATYQPRQVIGMAIGLFVMAAVACIDYELVLRWYWVYYIFTVIILIFVLFFGDDSGGAIRWLDLGWIRFQPSELGKVMLVLFFAGYFMKNEDSINN